MRALLLILVMACFQRPPPPDVVFVEDGLIVRPAEGPPRLDAPRAWTPGQQVEVDGAVFTAPEQPTCAALWSRPLGDASRRVAGGGSPDTDVAFSPDGGRVAVGTWNGVVWVLDAGTGEPLARRVLAETLIKRVAWSADGATLLAAEQSPDALVYALDPSTLSTRWTLRLAEHVGSSPPPDGLDPYGAYQLPAAFGLAPLPDGSTLVAAGHGWADTSGQRHNRGQLLRVGADGAVLAAWPERAAGVVLQTLRVDGGRAVVSINHTADGPAPADLPDGGLVLLDAASLRVERQIEVPPLGGAFPRSWMWEAVDLRGDRLLVGLGDGRARLLDLAGGVVLDAAPGTPIEADGVPIAASVGFGAIVGDLALFVTSGTNIPWGAADPAARPPVPHPGASSVHAWRASDGAAAWRWQGEQALEGLSVSPEGRVVVVGAGARQGDDRRDLFGALRFRALDGSAPRFCRTSSPVFFRHAARDDGRVVVVEQPWSPGAGDVAGAWQVTLLR